MTSESSPEAVSETFDPSEWEVLPGFEAGILTVPVAETFELDRVEDAYARFEAGGKLGKIVLLP